MEKIGPVGIDLARSVFQVHAIDAAGQVVRALLAEDDDESLPVLEPVRFRWVHLKRINRLAFICLEHDGRLNRYPLQAVVLWPARRCDRWPVG